MRVPILCYHRVHRDDDPQLPPTPPTPQFDEDNDNPLVGLSEYCGHLRLSTFCKQLDYLVDRGFTTITHAQLYETIVNGQSLPEPAVAIDFDDNRTQALEVAFPAMRERGLIGNMWVISQLAAGADLGDNMSRPFGYTDWNLDWDGIRELKKAGWLIGAHTRTHPFLGELIDERNGAARAETELKGSQVEIAEQLGEPPLHMASPAGSYNERVEMIVKRYYRTCRLWAPHSLYVYNDRSTNPYRLNASNMSEQVPIEAFRKLVDGVQLKS